MCYSSQNETAQEKNEAELDRYYNKQEKMRITNFLFVCSPDIKGNFEEKRKIKIKRECLAKGIY